MMNYKYPTLFKGLLNFFAVISFLSCNQSNLPPAESAKPEQSQAAPQPPATGPIFRFSTMSPVTGRTVVENWCLGRYNEPVVINAEKENTNRRYFYLAPGTSKVAIGPSGMTALFLLRPAENGVVEVFNGAHFPECLSMPANFSPTGAGPVIKYDNHKSLTFSMEVREKGGHSLITIELPVGNRYSMDVNHCSNCE